MKTDAMRLFLVILFFLCCGAAPLRYSIPPSPWPERFGNHRAVLQVPHPSDAVRVTFLWRRHDAHPEARRLVVVEGSTGDTIANIHRLRITNELCDLIIGPVRHGGVYHLYYLPFTVQTGWGYYSGDYLTPEAPPDPVWIRKNLPPGHSIARIPAANVVEIQSRSAFDSFFPMEITATSQEKQECLRRHTLSYLVYPEDRRYPIRMRDEIPYRWITSGPRREYSGTMHRNEYYTFQLGIWAARQPVKSVKVSFSDLVGDHGALIGASQLTCFNTHGVDPTGTSFEKVVDVETGKIQPLWIGVDVKRDQHPGVYSGTVTILPDGVDPQTVRLTLRVSDSLIADRGDSEPWRHSRLRWLNSTAGIDSGIVAPYTPIQVLGGGRYALLGREIATGPDGLPASIMVGGKEILAAPMRFSIEGVKGIEEFSAPRLISRQVLPGGVFQQTLAENEFLEVRASSDLDSDGYCRFRYTLRARADLHLSDVHLSIPFRREIATLMMGMGRPGSEVPERLYATWDSVHDSFWLGSAEGGIWCELRGARYSGPLLNVFSQGPPDSWWNGRKGGFVLRRDAGQVCATVYSGARDLARGMSIEFEFALLITPVKPLDMQAQFRDRYYHNGAQPVPSDEEIGAGVRIVNLHHATLANPYINYPFLAIPALTQMIDSVHARGLRLKIYYTIRELTSHVTEIWALRSLGDEILADGKGGGFPWLREHFVNGYSPQWYQHFDDQTFGVDASILTSTSQTRWYNYYVEGLAWLTRNAGIDGLYLDDVAYGRDILKRMRKVMDRAKPGCLIDLHSNTWFSRGPANQYAEFFPYVDKLWFGEGFQYDRMPPENWLVEVSGIPFGLTGDMLEGGGNAWRGMLYGMTVRYPWVTDGVTCDPRALWAVWDEFGLAGAEIVGYWDDRPIVTSDKPGVLATVYRKTGKAMIALASWADSTVRVRLSVDWRRLGIDSTGVRLVAPGIERFQPHRSFAVTDMITVEPRRGWLVILEKP